MTSDPPATDLLARQRVHYAKYASSIDSEGSSPKCLIKFSWVTARSHEKSSTLVAVGRRAPGPAPAPAPRGEGDGGAVSVLHGHPRPDRPTDRPPCAPRSPRYRSPPKPCLSVALRAGRGLSSRSAPLAHGGCPEGDDSLGTSRRAEPPPPRAGTAPPAPSSPVPFSLPSCTAALRPPALGEEEKEEEEETDPSSAAFLHRTPPFSPPSGLSAALAGPERAGGAGRRLAQHGRAMCILRNNSSCCAHDGEQRNARRRGLAGAGERAGPCSPARPVLRAARRQVRALGAPRGALLLLRAGSPSPQQHGRAAFLRRKFIFARPSPLPLAPVPPRRGKGWDPLRVAGSCGCGGSAVRCCLTPSQALGQRAGGAFAFPCSGSSEIKSRREPRTRCGCGIPPAAPTVPGVPGLRRSREPRPLPPRSWKRRSVAAVLASRGKRPPLPGWEPAEGWDAARPRRRCPAREGAAGPGDAALRSGGEMAPGAGRRGRWTRGERGELALRSRGPSGDRPLVLGQQPPASSPRRW